MSEQRLIRFYPSSWRSRYGDELLAMIDDVSGGTPSRRLRASLVIHGIREHLRPSRLAGRGLPPSERSRAGARAVLVGWAAIVIAGANFAKFSEHWTQAVPADARAVAEPAYRVIQILGFVGGAALLLVVAAALPRAWRMVRSGGWPALRVPALTAVALTVALLACGAGLTVWAHSLSATQRDRGSGGYGIAFLAVVLLAIATLAAWTLLAVKVERRLPMAGALLKAEWAAGIVLAAITVVIFVGIVSWWAQLGSHAPWFFADRAPGVPASWWSWRLAASALFGLAGSCAALVGAVRLASAGRDVLT
jgi:hypothetical protein